MLENIDTGRNENWIRILDLKNKHRQLEKNTKPEPPTENDVRDLSAELKSVVVQGKKLQIL